MNGDAFRLDGKVALVTGAGRGLGAGIAAALKEAGATVAGTSRDEESAREISDKLGTPPITMDVRNVGSIRAGVDRVVEDLGRVDVLVNNAGVNVPQSIFDVDEASWDTVMDTNLRGAFFASQAAARHMVEREEGGRIITVGSQAGEVGIEERSAYCSSKGGAHLMTKVLSLELAEHEVTANVVAPTFVATELTRSTLEDPVWGDRVLSRIPMGKVGQVDDVAAAVLYLASPAAGMVTGHVLLVDGGWTAR